ncbi:MAG: hypothetical protein ACT4QD_09250, partial [Acidobacteriota bacterium]
PRDNDLILASHARGVWILDDVTPIQQWAKAESAETFVFEPEPAVAFNPANDQMKGFEGDRVFLGANPAPGATLAFRLKDAAKEVRFTVRDARGTVVRELSGDAMRDRNRTGLNLIKWDLRVQPLRPLPPPPGAGPGGPGGGGGGAGGGGGIGGGGTNGPFLLPGTNRATRVVEGRERQAVDVVVKGDPEVQITDADRRTWHDTARELHQLQEKANDVAGMVQTAFSQVSTLQEQTQGATLSPTAKGALDGLIKEFEPLRRRLGLGGGGGPGGGGGFGGGSENVRGRIGQLKGAIMGSTSVPTSTQLMQIREVKAALPQVIDQANATVAKVAAVAKELLGSGALFPALKPVPK